MIGIIFTFRRQSYHSQYDSLDSRITGSRQPYHGIFLGSIKSSIVQKVCHSHLIEEAQMVNHVYKAFNWFHIILNA